MSVCCAIVCSTGNPCSAKAKEGSSFCGIHMKWIECPVCLNAFHKRDTVTLTCTHQFCTSCISKWRKHNKSCPCCRELIVCSIADVHKQLCDIVVDMNHLFDINERIKQVEKICKLLNTKYGLDFLKQKSLLKDEFVRKLPLLAEEIRECSCEIGENLKKSINIWKDSYTTDVNASNLYELRTMKIK